MIFFYKNTQSFVVDHVNVITKRMAGSEDTQTVSMTTMDVIITVGTERTKLVLECMRRNFRHFCLVSTPEPFLPDFLDYYLDLTYLQNSDRKKKTVLNHFPLHLCQFYVGTKIE